VIGGGEVGGKREEEKTSIRTNVEKKKETPEKRDGRYRVKGRDQN